ncbi:unnamed protein product [Ilex paraguariensis]|uniref:Uncharacterized protein n=1 Tax=Ilex paraguariensis TaxID=185542 RepID=A0ABC8V1U1_9AQUA
MGFSVAASFGSQLGICFSAGSQLLCWFWAYVHSSWFFIISQLLSLGFPAFPQLNFLDLQLDSQLAFAGFRKSMVRVVVNVGIFGSPELDSREKGRRQIGVRDFGDELGMRDFGDFGDEQGKILGDEFGRQRMKLRRILREILGKIWGNKRRQGRQSSKKPL